MCTHIHMGINLDYGHNYRLVHIFILRPTHLLGNDTEISSVPVIDKLRYLLFMVGRHTRFYVL